MAQDQPSALRSLESMMAQTVRHVTHAWSKCQNLAVGQQLMKGVRYLDLRIAKFNGEFRIVHGLYGPTVEEVLLEVLEFSTGHMGEVVILDFNHFYGMDISDHRKVVTMILSLFGDAVLPETKATSSLAQIQSHRYRFVVFYQIDNLHVTIPESNRVIWDKSMIMSPWTQKTVKAADVFSHQLGCARTKRAPNVFCVSQLIPSYDFDAKFVMKSLNTSLYKESANFSRDLVEWLKTFRDWSCINVVSVNFVDEDLCKMIVHGMKA